MIATQTFRLAAYELACSARLCDNGLFEPVLVIRSHTWPNRPRTIAMRRGNHVTAEEAIAAAHEQGVEWVAHFG